MLFTSPVAGTLFDGYGPRVPIAIGSVLHVFGLMMASLSHKYYQFMLSQSVVSGIGCSLIFTPAMSAVSFKPNQSPMREEQPPNQETPAPNLVSPEAGNCWGLDSGRIVIGRRHFSAHGAASAATGGLWLDDADLRLYDPGSAGDRQSHDLVQFFTRTTSILCGTLSRTVAGAQLRHPVHG